MAQRHWAWNTAVLPWHTDLPDSPLPFSSPLCALCISVLCFTPPPPPQFAHLLSLILWWSFWLFPCLQSLFFIFPLQPNCLGSYSPQTTPPPPHPISSFTRALTLSFYLVFAVNRDSQGSLGMLRDSKWGVRVQSTSFLFNKDTVICLQALIRWLIHTGDLIISLRGTRRVFKTVADLGHPFTPALKHTCMLHTAGVQWPAPWDISVIKANEPLILTPKKKMTVIIAIITVLCITIAQNYFFTKQL